MNMTEVINNVWKISSSLPGLIVAIVGGTHGNEKTGIEVVKRLIARFLSGELVLLRGELLLALGNPRAIEKNQRGSEEGADLNRCFTHTSLTGSSEVYEECRARELALALKSTKIGIDLHATNKPSTPFIVSQAALTRESARLCQQLGAKIILTDPNWIFAGEPVTLDEFFARNHGIGLCYETGLAEDTSRVDEVECEILTVLATLGLIAFELPPSPRSQSFYELTSAIILRDAGFRYADGFGTYNFQPIQAGELIGWKGRAPCRATEDGVIVFPKLPSLWRVGSPVGYLAKKK